MPLIRTRRCAIFVASVAGFLFALSIRSLFLYARHGGLVPFQPPFLSDVFTAWVVTIVSATLYACLIALYLIARDWERILVAGWFADVLLGPTKIGLPRNGALTIRIGQTAAVAVALLAALSLAHQPYGQPLESDVTVLERRSVAFYAFIIVTLLLGTVAYFVLQLP